MRITQHPGPLNLLAIKAAMKPDERIVCTNATVVMDSNENISYFRNDTPVCVIGKDEAQDEADKTCR